MSDFRLALRSLIRRPGFCVVVVLTLALGIGATSAIFTVVSAVLLKPLPYQAPERLAMIWSRWTNFDKTWISQDEFFDYQRQTQLFEDVGAWADAGEVTIIAPGVDPVSATSKVVTGNLFKVLGVTPVVGRTFTSAEDAPRGAPVVMIGYQLWQSRWGGDRSLVGRTITVDGTQSEVVGILPETFRYPLEFQQVTSAQIVQPIQFDATQVNRGGHCCYAVARLKPGITPAKVSKDLGALATGWTEKGLYPKAMHFTAFSIGMMDEVTGKIRVALTVVTTAVILLLLLTCANVANLILTRTESRSREVAVRAALGAGVGRILRLALTESLILGVTGGVFGLALAWTGVRVLVARAPTTVPRIADLTVDWRVVVFTMLLAVGTGVVFGLVPLIQARRLDLASALRDGRGQSAGAERRRGRTMLVVAEMALAVLLLIGAGLTIRSFMNLTNIDPGFDAENVMTMRVSLPSTKYATVESALGFYRNLDEQIRQIPGVKSVGFARLLPLATEMGDAGLQINGKPIAPNEPGRQADWQAVSPGYFETMKIKLIKGRFFDSRDAFDGQPVIAINQELAKAYFPGEEPIGQQIKVGRDSAWRTVIAVVGDVHHNGLQSAAKRGWYIPQEQWSKAYGNPRRSATIVIRTAGDPRPVLTPVQAIVHRMDADLPVTDAKTLSDVLAKATQEQRFTMAVMALFAVLALVLAAVGIYGVISHAVNQRTREIGIRVALGADVSSVRALVLRQGMVPAAGGVIAGLAVAFGLTRFLGSVLYGVAPVDAITFAVIPVALLFVAMMAVLIPAMRAARVDPVEALRAE